MPQVISVKQNTCSRCGSPMPPAALLCARCGHQHPSPYVVTPATYAPATGSYRSAAGLSIVLVILLALNGFQHLVKVFLDLRGVSLIHAQASGAGVDRTTMDDFEMLSGLSALGVAAVLLVTVVVFLCWFYRVHKNLDELRAGMLDFSHGWVVGWWFVPIMNLIRPKQIMDEIWLGSDPPGNEGLIPLWWGCWLIANFAANGARSMSASSDPSTVATGMQIDIVSSLAMVAAAAALIAIVRSVQAGQDAKSQRPHRRP